MLILLVDTLAKKFSCKFVRFKSSNVVDVLVSKKADADARDKVSVATVNITVELVGCD